MTPTDAQEPNAKEPGSSTDLSVENSTIPAYTLPDPLICADGTEVANTRAWIERRRPEILALFERHVYGKAPGRPDQMTFQAKADGTALDGKATRRLVAVRFSGQPDSPQMDILIYLPNDRPKPVPLFVGLNFLGNHTVHPDPSIPLARGWVPTREHMGLAGNQAPEASRGVSASRWPVERILERGYGDHLLWGPRSRFSRWLPERRPSTVLCGRTNRARSGRVGHDRRLVLGAKPGNGLL